MDVIETKPKLVFFQFQYDDALPSFLLMHKQEHVKCLSEFFDVTVIHHDCDYGQICDQYKPDLALFESGVNHPTCRRLQIRNVRSYPQVPKLGLHNADAFCNARAGFLSDMDHWGIDTFFAISMTTAEHTPEIADNLFVWPVFVDSDVHRDYGVWKSIPVLFTGNRNSLYPWRNNILKRVAERYPSLICPHPGYNPGRPRVRVLTGEEYARTINASWFVPACGTVAKELVRKHLEVPAGRACLVTERSAALEAAGFVDMVNCVFADDKTILDILEHLFDNSDRLREIIDAGHRLVHARHTHRHRDQILQWLLLHKRRCPGQRIIQLNPFSPLILVDTKKELNTQPVRSNGYHLELLRKGDEALSDANYESAEAFFIKCTRYMQWMPEPRLKLAICSLYKGNAERAISWIKDPLQFTLCVYNAVDPDPIEWAVLLQSLLCLGSIEEARKRSSEYAWLRHPELDRARWAVGVITDRNPIICEETHVKYRASIHRLPRRTFQEWREQLRLMLTACGQLDSAAIIERAPYTSNDVLVTRRVVRQEAHALAYFSKGLIYSRLWATIKAPVRGFLRGLERKYGYFMPFELSEAKRDELFGAVHTVLQGPGVHSILFVGAARNDRTTAAVLSAARSNQSRPSVFLVGRSLSRVSKCSGDSNVAWYELPRADAQAVAKQIDTTIAAIKHQHNLADFDAVVVNASNIRLHDSTAPALRAALHNARIVVLENIQTRFSQDACDALLKDPVHVLVGHNPDLRECGYALFEKRSVREHPEWVVHSESQLS